MKLPLHVQQRLASSEPPPHPDALPAHYSKLGSARRAAVRERYVELQDGACYYCKLPLDGPPTPEVLALPIEWRRFPKHFLRHPVHLHHCHKSDLTIGAVHALCNAVLWQYYGE